MEISATIAYNKETFSKSKIDFTVFDMSGQGKYRDIWQQYYAESEVKFLKLSNIGNNICY